MWNYGYVTDTNYHHQFFHELSPIAINFVLSSQGFSCPSLENFTYCELGFGQGFTLNLLASANPQGDFWGTDFNPNQALNAQQLADLAGLKNIHLFDLSFAEFLETPTPQFDFIVLHGVLSWISSENRHLAIEFLRRKLKLGGVVYVNYNTLPAIAPIVPLRDLMKFYFDQLSGNTIDKIEESIDFVEQVKNLNGEYFRFNTLSLLKWEEIKKADRHHLAHEYFNRDWQSFYHYDVVEMLLAAKLTFASGVDLTLPLQLQHLETEQLAFLNSIANPNLRETVIDYLFNRPFRRDIFVKGNVELNFPQRKQALSKLAFASTMDSSKMTFNLLLRNKQLSLSSDIYEPLIASLKDKPTAIGDIFPVTKFKEEQFVGLMTTLIALYTKGYIMPVMDDSLHDRSQSTTSQFNNAVIEQVILGKELNGLASPILGTGVTLPRYEQLFLYAYHNDRGLAQTTAEILENLNQRVTKNGQAIDNPQDHLQELSRREEEFLVDRLPILKQLKIV